MSSTENTLAELRRKEYELRIVVDRLRREVFQQSDPSASEELLKELQDKEQNLQAAEKKRAKAQGADPSSGMIVEPKGERRRRGMASTGLEAKVQLNMAQLPTSMFHLLDREKNPLITCEVKAGRGTVGQANAPRRVRVTSYIEGYSAQAVDTFEVPIDQTHTFKQLPSLFPERVRGVTELTRATLNVLVEDLDGKVELHETELVWLLARTERAPRGQGSADRGLAGPDALPGRLRDPERIQPHGVPSGGGAEPPRGSARGLPGKRGGRRAAGQGRLRRLEEHGRDHLRELGVDFNPDQGFSTQRVRLPRESLADKEANCIDGTVLFASLLEGISMNPAIVLVPGHAFLAWETWEHSETWRYLETTMIGSSEFEPACASAEKTADSYKA